MRPSAKPAARYAPVAVFAAACLWALADCAFYSTSPFPEASPPPELLAWTSAQQGLLLGTEVPPELRIPHWREISELIQGESRREESIWWLEALGVRYLLSPQAAKYHDAYECVAEAAGWCVYSIPKTSHAATLVSRELFSHLRAPATLYDLGALQNYVAWAHRLEPAVLEPRHLDPTATLTVDAGPGDLIHVRQPSVEDLTATRDDGLVLATHSDPLGFVVVDPSGPFAGSITLRRGTISPPPPAAVPLPAVETPLIATGGIVNAATQAPGLLHPGGFATIYGRRFLPGPISIEIGGMPAPVTFSSAHQINAAVPAALPAGFHAVNLTARGFAANQQTVEVVAR